MAKNHDERIDVMRLKRMGCNFSYAATTNDSVKCISIPKNGLGIKSLGRVDYLVHYCGYRIVSGLARNNFDVSETKSFRDIKKAKKAPKLTDKTKQKKTKKK